MSFDWIAAAKSEVISVARLKMFLQLNSDFISQDNFLYEANRKYISIAI
jgi:hypothetical protein